MRSPTLKHVCLSWCTALVIGAIPIMATAAQTLTLGLVGTMNSPEGRALQSMAQYVAQQSNNQLNIKVSASGVLGGEREMLEGVQLGTVDLEFLATAVIGNFDPEIQILDTPFLYRDLAHAESVLMGPIGDSLMKPFEQHGFIGLTLGGNGFRELTNNKLAVKTPADVHGLKIRTMENPVYVSVWKTLGASPTPMSVTEVYSALQQGVVDGQENPIGAIINNRFDEVQKYVSMINYAFNSAAIVASPATFNSLSKADQDIIRAGAKLAMKETFENVRNDEKSGLKKLRDKGLVVVEHPDVDAFRAAIQPVYKDIYARFGEDKIDAIRNYKE